MNTDNKKTNTFNFQHYINNDIEIRQKLEMYLHSDFSDCLTQRIDFDSSNMYVSQLSKFLKFGFVNSPINWITLLTEVKDINLLYSKANVVEKQNIKNLIFDIKAVLTREVIKAKLAENYLNYLNNSLDTDY